MHEILIDKWEKEKLTHWKLKDDAICIMGHQNHNHHIYILFPYTQTIHCLQWIYWGREKYQSGENKRK